MRRDEAVDFVEDAEGAQALGAGERSGPGQQLFEDHAENEGTVFVVEVRHAHNDGRGSAHGCIANLLWTMGHRDEAVRAFVTACAMDQQIGDKLLLVSDLTMLGKCHLEAGAVPAAIDALERALAERRALSRTDPWIAEIERWLTAALDAG